MRQHLKVCGPAPAEVVWERYFVPARWPEWSPQIRHVDYPFATLRPDTAGVVHGPLGLAVPFTVTAVDPVGRHWRWRVQVGPVRLQLAHLVTAAGTELVIDGPAPIVLGYRPLAQLALSRLVRA